MSEYKKGTIKESYGSLAIVLIILFFWIDKFEILEQIEFWKILILIIIGIGLIIITFKKIKYFIKHFKDYGEDIIIGTEILLLLNICISFDVIHLFNCHYDISNVNGLQFILRTIIFILTYLFITILQLPEARDE